MIPKDVGTKGQRFTFKLKMYLILASSPVAYFIVAWQMFGDHTPSGSVSDPPILLYVFLPLAIIVPLAGPMVQKVLIVGFKSGKTQCTSELALYDNIMIIRSALVIASYIWGLMLVFITQDMTYLWYFYPIGITWTIIRWPTEEKYREFVRKLEAA